MNIKTYVFIAVLILLAGVVGYGFGFSEGVNLAMDKSISAFNMMFDVELTGKAKNMIFGFPDIVKVLPLEIRDKLGLNSSSYEEYQYQKLNETISKIVEMKYGR